MDGWIQRFTGKHKEGHIHIATLWLKGSSLCSSQLPLLALAATMEALKAELAQAIMEVSSLESQLVAARAKVILRGRQMLRMAAQRQERMR